MNFPFRAAVFASLIFATPIFAQAPATNAAPRRNFPAAIVSPQIQTNNTVTFRIRAPKANEVMLQGQWKDGRAPMAKGSNDVWSVTVGPIDAGVWEYSFNVDGLTMIDPANPWIKPQRSPNTSILHLRGNPPKPWDFMDVPHGTVRFHTYNSKTLGRLREVSVYTPPGYEKGSQKYPLLILQHGSGDNQATWTVHGKAHWILDNLIAEKKAKPMVVVMMDGHAAVGGPGGGNNTQLFEKDLFDDVMPLIEATYRVKKGAENRGIVGLSMGGGQSLTIGLNHLDQFHWVGGFSSAAPNKEAVEKSLDDGTAKKLKLLWIGVGKDDFLLKNNEQFTAFLKEKQIPFEWNLTEGNHSWPVWRNYLTMFLPKLF